MNNKGQITLEYILMTGIIIVILIGSIQTINTESEKNTILSAAQMGAQMGVDKNAYAMYYNDTFNNYATNNLQLIFTMDIRVINISMTQEENSLYLQATIHSNTYLTDNQREIISQRVNYYIRKTISQTFDQKNADVFYENVKSNNYNIKTKKVNWV